MSATSASMLRGLRRQEDAAWERLADKYTYAVYRTARRAGLRPEDARDITQEVFRSAFRSLPNFQRDRPGDTFRGWLIRIAQRRIADRVRELRRQVGGGIGGSDHFGRMFEEVIRGREEPSAASTHQTLVREALEAVRGTCKEQNWEIFSQIVFDDRTPEEVAAVFGVSCAHVYNVKCRFLRRLRDELIRRGFPALPPE